MRALALLLALLALLAAAQDAPPPRGDDPFAALPEAGLSDGATASLLTMLPGAEVYSLFGHSAIRIRDAASGLDRTYNFGTFSFDQPFFVLRFLRGSLDYSLDTAPFEFELRKYRFLERPIVEQTLALDPAAVRALYDGLEVNARPENRAYRYDFFWDNCSTRLLDAIDDALVATGRPGLALPPVETERTFRELIAPYVVADRAVGLGMTLGLGVPADRVATAREETFLPLELAAQLDRATVDGAPLVAARDTLFWVEGAGLPAPAPRTPLWALVAVAAVGIGATARRRPRSRVGRVGDAALFGVVGAAGLVLAFLWLGTAHEVTRPNLNLLWAWPTHVAVAVAAARGRIGPGGRRYLLASAVVTAATVLAWPVLPQELPLAAAPVAVLLAVRAGALARAPAPAVPA